MKVCFYGNVTRNIANKVEFYNNDLKILNDLGHQVIFAESILDVIKAKDIDIYYVWWWNRALLVKLIATLNKKPVIVSGVLDYFIPYKNKHDYVSRNSIQKHLIRMALKYCDYNLFICDYEFRQGSEFFKVKNPLLNYLSVDSEKYSIKNKTIFNKKILNIAWSGDENAKRKGLFQLIKALPFVLEHVEDIHLVLAGREGGALPRMKMLASELGVDKNITFVGEVSEDEKLKLMHDCEVYIQPSFYEGFGLAVAEAMSTGLPVISSINGSLLEVVGITPFSIHHIEEKSIANSIIKYFSLSQDERSNIARANSDRVRREFDYNKRKSIIEEVFKSAVNKK